MDDLKLTKELIIINPLIADTPSTHLILNSKLNLPLFSLLRANSIQLICADGGANSLFKIHSVEHNKVQSLPQMIIGDLDSIGTQEKHYFKQQHVQIKEDPNQDSTDLTKCLEIILQQIETQQVLIQGSLGGRLDHTLSIISTLLEYQTKYENKQFLYFGEKSIVRILLPGKHCYKLDQRFQSTEGVGIFPCGSHSARVTTNGFQWNLSYSQPLKWGEFTSSSNKIIEDTYSIFTSDPICLITTLKNELCDE